MISAGRSARSRTTSLLAVPDFVHVVREDPYNRDLLFAGTDVGVYVSTNRGASWQKFMKGCLRFRFTISKFIRAIARYRGNARPVDLDRRHRSASSRWSDSAMGAASVFLPANSGLCSTHCQFTQPWNGNKIYVADNPPYGATFTIAFRRARCARLSPNRHHRCEGRCCSPARRIRWSRRHRVNWDLRGLARRIESVRYSRQHMPLRGSVNSDRDSVRRAGGDSTGAGRNLPGMDTTAARHARFHDRDASSVATRPECESSARQCMRRHVRPRWPRRPWPRRPRWSAVR